MLQPFIYYFGLGAIFILLGTVVRVRGYRLVLAAMGLAIIAVALWF